MNSAVLIAATVFVGVAALIHVFIFVLESVRWSRPATWRTFGLSTQAEADIVKPMAFNQGFYNLFLAIGAVVGLVLLWGSDVPEAGLALVFLAAGSMVAAATVLILSSPRLARSAAIQGAAPLIGVVLVILAVAGG